MFFPLKVWANSPDFSIPGLPVLPGPPPEIVVSAPQTDLSVGETLQLTVEEIQEDGSRITITSDPETSFSLIDANENRVTVSSSGLLTAIERGNPSVMVFFKDVAQSNILNFHVRLPDDADDDGMTDAFETLHGLDPNDPADAELDSDGDGLTNLEEFEQGADPNSIDTDGDGFSDSEEVSLAMDPSSPDEFLTIPAHLLLDQNCMVSVLNRTAQVNPDGTFTINNLPCLNCPLGAAPVVVFRARAVCRHQGRNLFGQSDFLVNVPGEIIDVGVIKFFADQPAPLSLDYA